MNLAEQLLERLTDSTLTYNERARLRCRLSKELEESGDYEGARRAMGELWQRVGERPTLDRLDNLTKAEVLLRAGVLTGWIGSVKQIEDAQETAKNLISESITLFGELQSAEKVAEAQTELAYCYWRQGALDEARDILCAVLDHLADTDSEVKMVAIIRRAIVERSAKRYRDALHIHTEAAPLFEQTANHSLKGRFHIGFAIVLQFLGTAENREDYIDRALIEYTAASFHCEQAGHLRYYACVENNLAVLYLAVGRLMEAHEHLDRARPILANLKDSVHVAQTDETRAKVLLAEGRNAEAEKIAAVAVRTLEKGDEQSLQAEALTTHGIALARTGRHTRAHATLHRAAQIAAQAGDRAAAGRAALTIIEELSTHATRGELCTLYEQAADNLAKSQHPRIAARLIAGACLVLRRFKPQPPAPDDVPADWQGFSFRKAVRHYERTLIERALNDAGGAVTRAAELLGFKHHQSLISLLNNRHKDLLPARTPAVPRKRSLIGQERGSAEKQARSITILHAEDNQVVADSVRETLEHEGWKVDTCPDGAMALRRIESDTVYDVLLFDYDLPRFNGIELVRRARQTAHRKRTPIIMLSATDCEREAWRAGVTAFLRKPNGVLKLTETITRVLVAGSKR
jgi:CheY-like chemotaxis protein/tetratricopeptide (TPR) repeat protein